jgi:hypothetical protein
MNDTMPARLITLNWDSFALLRQLYGLRADGRLDTSFQVASFIFDNQHYLFVEGERYCAVSATALHELNEQAFTSSGETLRERMQKTLYANRRDRYLLHEWEACDHFFAQPPIRQLSTLTWEALHPIITRDVSIEALCVALGEVADQPGSVQRRRVGTLLGALTPYVHQEPRAVGVALRFAGGFLANDWL